MIEIARKPRSQTPPIPNTPRITTPKERSTSSSPPVQSEAEAQPMKRPKQPRSKTVSVPSIPRMMTPKKRSTLPLPRASRHSDEQGEDPGSEAQERGTQENAIVPPPRGWKALRAVAKAAGKFMRLIKTPRDDRGSSTQHDPDPLGWKYVVSGLINTVFSDRDEVKAIGGLRGDDAQIFTDMVYEVHSCALQYPETTTTNFRWGFRSGIGVP